MASGSLNLLKKEDEYKSSNPDQKKYITDLFEFFLIILTNDFDKYSRETLISDLIEKILPKMKIDSISKYYFIFFIFFREYDISFIKKSKLDK